MEARPLPSQSARLKPGRRSSADGAADWHRICPAEAWQATYSPSSAASEGSPVLREPASPASAARRAKAQAARRERRAGMPGANVRRRGTGDPEATLDSSDGRPLVACLWALPSAGAAKVSSPRIALDQSRGPVGAVGAIGDSSSVRRPRPHPLRWQERTPSGSSAPGHGRPRSATCEPSANQPSHSAPSAARRFVASASAFSITSASVTGFPPCRLLSSAASMKA